MPKNLKEMSLVDQLYEIKNGLESEMKVLGYANNTIRMYMNELDYFINFCVKYDGEIDFTEINRPIILEALDYREKQSKDGKISANTKEVFIKALKRLFAYIEDNIDDERNYMRMFKNIKVQKETKEKEYLTDEEIERLLNVLEQKKKNPSYTNFKNVLLIKLLLFGGLRINEALNLQIGDFEFGNGGSVYKVRVLGKGNKEGYVYIKKELIEDELNEIIKERKSGHIFVTKSGRLMTSREARGASERLYQKAKIFKHGLHMLRHTLAMKLVREGVDIVHIKKILRHSNIATTTVYAKSNEDSLVEIARNLGHKP